MKHQAILSSKDRRKKLKCCLLQFLFGALRVKRSKLKITGVIFISLPVLSTEPVSYHTCKSGCQTRRKQYQLGQQPLTIVSVTIIGNACD